MEALILAVVEVTRRGHRSQCIETRRRRKGHDMQKTEKKTTNSRRKID